MAGLLIYLVFFTIGWLFYFWYKNTRIQKETYNVEYLRKKLQEWDWLYDNTEINQAMDEVKSLGVKAEPVETAQPVSEPTAADNLIKEAKEWKV